MEIRGGDSNLLVQPENGGLISTRDKVRITMCCASGDFMTSWASSAPQHSRRHG